MSWKRSLGELVVVAILAAAAWGWLTWQKHNAGVALDAHRDEWAAETARLRSEASGRLDALARDRGRAYAEAFAAATRPAILEGRLDLVDSAIDELLQSPDVVWIHFLDPDGRVVVSSDRKLAGTVAEDPLSKSAVAATTLEIHPSDREGVVDIVVPYHGQAGRLGTLRLGYDLGAALQRYHL